ncbi:hypothetical protein ACLOJK_037804 [Asimina triloba]
MEKDYIGQTMLKQMHINVEAFKEKEALQQHQMEEEDSSNSASASHECSEGEHSNGIPRPSPRIPYFGESSQPSQLTLRMVLNLLHSMQTSSNNQLNSMRASIHQLVHRQSAVEARLLFIRSAFALIIPPIEFLAPIFSYSSI